jgi:hypothetical protein
VIDAGLRNTVARETSLPALDRVRVEVRDAETAEPIAAARVRVWQVHSSPPYECSVITECIGGNGGMFHFDWGVAAPFNSRDHLRLIKAYADGYAGGAAYVSVFDAQEAKLLERCDTLSVTLALEPSSDRVPATPVRLWPSQPNPFRPWTTIRYWLGQPAVARLAIYDARGALVAVLQDGPLDRGEHVARWDGTARSGREVPSGVYFCRLRVGATERTQKLVRVR